MQSSKELNKKNGPFTTIVYGLCVAVFSAFFIFVIPRIILWPEKVDAKLEHLMEKDKELASVDEKLAQADLNLSEALREINFHISNDVDKKIKSLRESRDRELNQLYDMIKRIDDFIKD